MTTTTTYEALREHGDTMPLPDGRTLRLRVTPDDSTGMDDFDLYGEAWPTEHTDRTVKLLSIVGPFDWEPPADYESMHEDDKASLRVLVGEIVSFGFSAVWLELLDGEDAYGSPVVVDYAVIGGVEPLAGDYDIAAGLTDYLLPDLGLG